MERLGSIAILGTGVTGLAVARTAVVLKGRGLVDSILLVKPSGAESLTGDEHALAAAGVRIVGPDGFTEPVDLAVPSPGISPSADLFLRARELATETISEPELAYRISPGDWVAVTGTNGKTTTTLLIAHILQSAGRVARAVGNIGPTCIEAAIAREPGDILVAELSSYQLHSIRDFEPSVAVITNVTPDHLTWHGGMDDYLRSKLRVFENMGEQGLVVFDRSDPGIRAAMSDAQSTGPLAPRIAGIDPSCAPERDCEGFVRDGVLYVRLEGVDQPLGPVSDLMIRGEHNVANALLAAVACLHLGLGVPDVWDGLVGFAPIAHRIEPVGIVSGVSYYNDSKATNPEATMKALTAFDGSAVILLLGGLDKGTDLSGLIELARNKARDIVVFGQAAERFEEEFARHGLTVMRERTMEAALVAARGIARPGDVVLLSPACASFDEFDSFEHRGDTFRTLVDGLGAGEGR